MNKHDMLDMPQIMQDTVREYLDSFNGAKIIGLHINQSTPFVDETITSTRYVVYVEYGNTFTVFSMYVRSDPLLSDKTVSKNTVNAWDIRMIIGNASVAWFSDLQTSLDR